MAPTLSGAAKRARHECETLLLRGRYAWRTARPPQSRLATQLGGRERLAAAVESWRTWSGRRFFLSPGEARQVADLLSRVVPGWRQTTVDAADRIAGHRVRILGNELELDLGSPLEWHRDAINGYEWDPAKFFRAVEIPYDRADVKAPWELSRFQHLPTLGMAYLLTGKQSYATEAVSQIDGWIDANPEGRGVNWACPMDVAIRAVNWLWALSLLAGANAVTDRFALRLVGSLLAHGEHVHANLETRDGGVTTNHAVADFTGLLMLGLALPELAAAERWAADGMAGLERCMATQVAPDGVEFENSVSYHRLTLEMFAASQILAERNGRGFSAEYRSSLDRMFRFVSHCLRDDGTAPLVGDNDDGRLQILSRYFDWRPADHRYLLALGGALTRDEALAGQGLVDDTAMAEVAWLLTAEERDWLARREAGGGPRESRAFADSGRYVMRRAGHHALISVDPVGSAGRGAHKHNDILSYELTVGGRPLVVDPGTYLYTSSREWREEFRRTRAHNTLVVDGEEQNSPAGWFGMRPDAEVRVRRWQPGAEADLLDAGHTGYRRLPRPTDHRRRMVMVSEPFAWLVLDSLIDGQGHDVESNVHLPAGASVGGPAPLGGDDGRMVETALSHALAALPPGERFAGDGHPPERAMRIAIDDASFLLTPLGCAPPRVERGWVAPCYGVRKAAPVLRFEHQAERDREFGYLITVVEDG